MPREDAIHAEGVVVEVLANGLFQVELTNGHRLRAWVPAKRRNAVTGLTVGSRVTVELTPFDLSQGGITGS